MVVVYGLCYKLSSSNCHWTAKLSRLKFPTQHTFSMILHLEKIISTFIVFLDQKKYWTKNTQGSSTWMISIGPRVTHSVEILATMVMHTIHDIVTTDASAMVMMLMRSSAPGPQSTPRNSSGWACGHKRCPTTPNDFPFPILISPIISSAWCIASSISSTLWISSSTLILWLAVALNFVRIVGRIVRTRGGIVKWRAENGGHRPGRSFCWTRCHPNIRAHTS